MYEGLICFGHTPAAVSEVSRGAILVDFDAVWLLGSADGTFVARVDRHNRHFGDRNRRFPIAESRILCR